MNTLAREGYSLSGDSNMRNDNDSNIVERNELLSNTNMNNDNYMTYFDEEYYLDDSRKTKKIAEGDQGIEIMNANGGLNETLLDNRKITRNELLKKKSLDLETLIVERITRDRLDDAKRIFSVLEKMHRKYNDEGVSDIYYRVLQSMPKSSGSRSDIYSYRQDKNNFKEVLNNLNNQNNIKAFNEDNPCINSLGQMWEECDINICSDKCKQKILSAKTSAEKEECDKIVTGMNDEKKIMMKDDIKDIILQRLQYCKKVADLEKGNFDLISYTDKLDLKNKTIEDITKMARLANMHYNSCHDKASEFFSTDEKYRGILNLLKTVDFNKLSLEKLQTLRNDLTMLPTCDMLKFKSHDENREEDVKDGIRVGKYIIPKKTDYYEQIKGKDRPFVYKDVATDKHYLYDSFSKTLTGFEYPMTEDSLAAQQMNNQKYDKKLELGINNLGPAIDNTLYNINFEDYNNSVDTPSPSPVETVEEEVVELEVPSPSEKIEEKVEKSLNSNNKKILFNLTFKQVIEYLFLILILFVVLLTFSLML